jgi:anti-anti-sigma factor
MSTALTFTTGRRADGAVVLAAAGEIDMSNAGAFAEALAGTRPGEPQGPVVVDLTRVEYLDSAGLAALFPHVEHIHLVVTSLLAPLLAVAGLDDIATIQDA